jgi:hypothetical protein
MKSPKGKIIMKSARKWHGMATVTVKKKTDKIRFRDSRLDGNVSYGRQ